MNGQCKGLTRSGERCRIKTGLVNGYCRLHRRKSPEMGESTIKKVYDSDDTRDGGPVTEVASNVNRGMNTILLIITALLSLIIVMFLKKKRNATRS